jgi:oxalate decarboxylase/phosphoglucose isomerase-like protein (cupin superfamily)
MLQLGSGWITYGDDVESLVFDWGTVKFLSEPEISGANNFSFGMVVLAPGKGHERHNHPGSEEVIFVMSGEGEQMIDDKPVVKVGPGASIFIPADIYHSTVNIGWEPLRCLVVYSPAGPERIVRDIPGCQVLAPGQVPD